jgi:zinc/manganese transport system substrate-binding protein
MNPRWLPRTARGTSALGATALGTTLGMAATALLLGGCGAPDGSAASGASGSQTPSAGTISIVTSTNVWGAVAKSVGGDAVTVRSFISEPSQDPHSFEASSTTLLAVSKSGLVIENGGGYDDFMDRMVEASDSEATVINAVDASGRTAPSGGELNEHVWYDLPSVEKVADLIARELGKERPGEADAFASRAADLKAEIETLVEQESRLKRQVGGMRIGITEPVPLYLTEAAGLVNATPAEFSEAVEEGEDVSPSVLQETIDLFADRQVAALVYNEQTSGPVTEKVKASAQKAGIPIVPVTETLPEGLDYVSWMRRNLTSLQAAVAGE